MAINEFGRYIGLLTETGSYPAETGRYPFGIVPALSAVKTRALASALVLTVDSTFCSPCGIGATGAMSATLLLTVDSTFCSPCGLGTTRALTTGLQLGISFACGLAAAGSIGGGGTAAQLSALVRIAGGGSEAVAAQLSIDGDRYRSALSQAMPMSAMSGSGTLSAPLALANPAALSAPYDVVIMADGRNITDQISECSIVSSESALFDTISLSLPDGSVWLLDDPPAEITVTLPGAMHVFMVEEFGGDGPVRTIWGRPLSAAYAEPWSSSSVWNERRSSAATASSLAQDIAGAAWAGDDFPLPPRWEIDGTPAEALNKLASASGGVALAVSDVPGISIRRRWPVRPVDMTSATVIINRETALELSIDPDSTPSYGSVIVHGFSPDALLPKFAVESSPVLGQPAYLRLYWQGVDHPPVSNWITDGSAANLGRIAETITETVVFTDGVASVAWPIWDLLESEWLGSGYGAITWLESGYSTDLGLSSPGYGVALVTYRTEYERWLLSAQAVKTVLFGVDISRDALSGNIQLASGGLAAGEVKEPLLGSVPACVVRGAALLDDSQIRHTVKATLPRMCHIETGEIAWVEDELTGIAGFGKITGVETRITPTRITQVIGVALC